MVIIDLAADSAQGVTSQVFPDLSSSSTWGFDDFTLSGTTRLTSLLIRGTELGDSAFNVDVNAAIWSTPDATGTPLYSISGAQISSDLSFDLSGITLSPGTYWLSAQVVRPLSGGGQWYWYQSNEISGSLAVWQNPGGGLGLGSSAIVSPTRPVTLPSFSFRLEGDPVPGPFPALGAVAAFAASRRLRSRIRAARP